MTLAIIFILGVTFALFCCLRVNSDVEDHTQILHDFKNEKY